MGLDPEELVAVFARIYPESPDRHRIAPRPGRPQAEVEPAGPPETLSDREPEPSALRLVLDAAAPTPRPSRLEQSAPRVAAALGDVLLPLAAACGAAFVAGREWFWVTAACVGIAGHLVVFGLIGATPGTWLLRRGREAAADARLGAQSRRQTEAEIGLPGRRHVPRHPSSRPASRAHRTHH